MHMVSKKDLNSAELETMRTSRSPDHEDIEESDDGGDGQRRGANKRRSDDLFVKVTLLEETPAVFSLAKLCEDHGYTYHWTSGQKTHISPEMAIELMAIYGTMCHS